MMMMPMESSENRIIEITTALQNEEIVKLSSLFSKRMTSSGDAASDTTTTTGVTAIEEGNSKKFIPSYAVRNGEGAITSSYIKSDPTVAGANDIQLTKGSVTINNLNPREQEKEDEPIIKGLDCLMNNEFMAAKTIFEKKAQSDPLSALALSSMAFLKAVMTSAEQDQDMALNALNVTYDIANTQLELSKQPSKISTYFPSYYKYLRRPEDTTDALEKQTSSSNITNSRRKEQQLQGKKSRISNHPSNGVLRAHVIKAECCLQMAVLQLLQESMMGYLKCGLNLRRAFVSYNYVWQEYQKMGSDHTAFMDADTVSGVQFGIGSVHLVLSALPAKILKAFSFFGWKPDRELGISLLNKCRQSQRVRSSMATITLLSYYTVATSFAPQILTDVYSKTCMDILLQNAQKYHPDSTLNLFFAGRTARQYGFDLPLSTQSFLYAAEISRGEWAEVAVTNACRFEMALNHMVTGNWEHAAATFEYLEEQQYWSVAFCRYAQGACYSMIPERRENAILCFAQVPQLINNSRGDKSNSNDHGNRKYYQQLQHKIKQLGGGLSDINTYILRKVTMFQKSGYQNLHFYVPALEFMCLWNLFPYASPELLVEWLNQHVQTALMAIQKCEMKEQEQRLLDLAPNTPLPDYFNERATLYVIKSSIRNSFPSNQQQVLDGDDLLLDINWVVDHKDCISEDTWTVPYALWEAGVISWSRGNKLKSKQLWEMALQHRKHDFEYRLAVRLTLCLLLVEESGIATTLMEG